MRRTPHKATRSCKHNIVELNHQLQDVSSAEERQVGITEIDVWRCASL